MNSFKLYQYLERIASNIYRPLVDFEDAPATPFFEHQDNLSPRQQQHTGRGIVIPEKVGSNFCANAETRVKTAIADVSRQAKSWPDVRLVANPTTRILLYTPLARMMSPGCLSVCDGINHLRQHR
jgi:hypothetical protein